MSPKSEPSRPAWKDAADGLFKIALFMMTILGTLFMQNQNEIKEDMEQLKRDMKTIMQSDAATTQKAIDLDNRMHRVERRVDKIDEEI